MSGVEKPSPRRPLLAELNPHLMCILCGGYYVDAAAIIECLHTFCKSCLVRYLETNKYCPICDVQVHKTRPLQNIRPDPTLQDMVYKLVPGLYHKEMKCRREFYSKSPNAPPTSLEDRGDVPPELSPFYAPDETVNLVLEYRPPDQEEESTGNNKEAQNKRFLRCPAAVKITHLEKLLRNKYTLDNRYNIELMFDDSKLSPDLSLMEVAYAFGRKRKEQFLFTYRIYDSQCKKMRLSCDSPDEDMRLVSPLSSQVVKTESEKAPTVETISSSAETTATTTTTSASTVPIVSVPVTAAPPVSTCVSSTATPVTVSSTITVTAATVTTVTTSVTSLTTSVASVPTWSTPVTFASSISITPLTIPLTPVKIPGVPAATTTVTPSASIPPVGTSAGAAPVVTPAPHTASSVSTAATATVSTSLPAKTTSSQSTWSTGTSVHSPATPTTPTDGKSKLDSIISRLGDPSKHQRSESNARELSSPAAPKQESSARKTQGKEVQLRISENGVMKFTSMGLLDKFEKPQTAQAKTVVPPSSPLPKPTTKVGHSVKVSDNSPNSESAPKPGAVAPVSPNVVASPRKPSSSPVGYKTLKSGPKTWNPTISRNSFLSAKLEQQQQQQQQLQKQAQQNKDSGSGGAGTKPATEAVAKPPRFFKARNTPRYLGNPASGVKPMYQIAPSAPPAVQNQKPSVKPPPKPPAVLKIDPRTLTPIMTSAAVSSPPPCQSSQAKDKPPFLSTTISGAMNHTPSSRCVTTTSTTVTESVHSNSSSSSKLSSDLAMRSSPTLPYHRRFPPGPFCDPLNPFAPRLGDAGLNRMPSPAPYAAFGSLFVNSYGQCRPPPVGMLYSQPLHRQLNHQGPLSPVPGLPSPLPPSPAPLSPSSTPKNVVPPAHWGPASPSSPVPLPPQPLIKSPISKSLPSKVTDDQSKVNGEKPQLKDRSAKKTDNPTVQSQPPAEKEKKVEEARPPYLKDTSKDEKSREQDNNNTLVADKKSPTTTEPVKEQSKSQTQQLSHNISKLCNPSPAGKELPSPGVENSSADQTPAVTK